MEKPQFPSGLNCYLHALLPNTTDLNAHPPLVKHKAWLTGAFKQKGQVFHQYSQTSPVYPCQPVKQSGPSDQHSQFNEKHIGILIVMVLIRYSPYIGQLHSAPLESVLKYNK